MKNTILSHNESSVKEYHPISNNNWNIECDVDAVFSVHNDDNNIFLEFKVEEPHIRALYMNFNEPVYEDSCVEFFISFDNVNYYNLEFNCIGTILGGYGPDRNHRTALDIDLLKRIKTIPSLGFNKIEINDQPTEWTLRVTVPKDTFSFDRIRSLSGLKASANFYKCGDMVLKPHYLSWNPIHSEQPNFHLPEYFGTIKFA